MKGPRTTITPVESRYMIQLDSLRAFAVLAVMFFHFFQRGREGTIQLGHAGVTLFFVLSGFLITGILLKSRQDIDQNNNLKFHLKQFYVRRALRIFPLFYAVVILGTLAHVRGMRESFFWNVTYTSNLYYALRGKWGGPDSHFWTLSIEEQFYLIWPFLVLVLSRKHIVLTVAATFVLAIVFRVMVYALDLSFFLNFLTIARLDALSAGALLALFQSQNPTQFKIMAEKPAYNWVGLLLFLLALSTAWARTEVPLLGVIGTIFPPLLAFWIIHRASVGVKGSIGRLLQWKPLIYCGRISYGLYVYHIFVREFLPDAVKFFHMSYPQEPYLQTLLLTTVSLFVATISWYFFEKPINDLKRCFSYNQQKSSHKTTAVSYPLTESKYGGIAISLEVTHTDHIA